MIKKTYSCNICDELDEESTPLIGVCFNSNNQLEPCKKEDTDIHICIHCIKQVACLKKRNEELF